jgi:hypothetical protein
MLNSGSSMSEEQDLKIDSNISSETLCAHIVAYKFLGVNRQMAIKCMQEIALRKNKGDVFDYDGFINEELRKLPKPTNMDHKSLLSVFSSTFSSLSKK